MLFRRKTLVLKTTDFKESILINSLVTHGEPQNVFWNEYSAIVAAFLKKVMSIKENSKKHWYFDE